MHVLTHDRQDNAKKMAARLQAATSSDAPVLLPLESGGHGIGQALDKEIDLLADMNAFALAQVGVTWSPPDAARR